MSLNKNPTILKLSSFFGQLSFYSPIAPIFFLDKGVSLSLIIMSQAFYSIAIILAEVPTGVLADKFGNRRSVIAGGVCETLGMATFLISPNVYGLFIGYGLLGIGDAFKSGSAEALLYEGNKAEGKKKEYKRNFSHILSYQTLAFSVGTAIVGVVYGSQGLAVLPLLIGMSVASKAVGVIINTRLTEVPVDDVHNLSDSSMWQTFRKSMSIIKGDSTLLNLTYVKLLSLTAQYVVLSSYQTLFEEKGVSAYFIGLTLTIGGFANALSMRYTHLIEKYLSLEKVVLYFNLGLSVTYLAFASVSHPAMLVLVFIAMQAQYNIQDPIISDYVNDRTQSGIRATVLSGISLVRSIGNTLSKITLGLAVAGVGVGGMLRIHAIYLALGAMLSYWLLVRCGCVYKLSHDED